MVGPFSIYDLFLKASNYKLPSFTPLDHCSMIHILFPHIKMAITLTMSSFLPCLFRHRSLVFLAPPTLEHNVDFAFILPTTVQEDKMREINKYFVSQDQLIGLKMSKFYRVKV